MDTHLINERFRRLTSDVLPLAYQYEGRCLEATATTVYHQLKFSEWGMETGYEQSIVGHCEDFITGKPAVDGIIIIDGRRLRILNSEKDAARVGVRIDLGPEFGE